ncbi:interleukin-15 [Rhinoraja longicauda]
MSPLFCIFALPLTVLSLMRSSPFTQRRQVKRVYFNYNLHLNLDCHIFTFINTETGFSLLLLCSLAVCLPKADGADSNRARKMKRSAELKEILELTMSIHKQVSKEPCHDLQPNISADLPELLLYTPADVPDDCFNTALNCFISEMEVVNYEFKLVCKKLNEFKAIFYNAKALNNTDVAFSNIKKGCTTCEEFQEKNVTEFLKAFEALLQGYNWKKEHGKLINSDPP